MNIIINNITIQFNIIINHNLFNIQLYNLFIYLILLYKSNNVKSKSNNVNYILHRKLSIRMYSRMK